MLSDTIRTSAYQQSILNNPHLFNDNVVMDLGAGSGILSYFAVQAGAKLVYAVEASGMAARITKLVKCENNKNSFLKDKIIVVACTFFELLGWRFYDIM